MKRILIKVVGSQSVDNERDRLELTTLGTLKERDDTYIIRYNEEQEPPSAPIKVTVTIKKDNSSVEITRNGAASSSLTVEASQRHLCHYGTEFGDILLGISGRSVESDIRDNGGSINFCYDIDMNGVLVSKNEVDITFKIQE